jgi:hypothetical protein
MKLLGFLYVWLVLAFLVVHCAESAPKQFPKVHLHPLTLLGVWESAPTVLVGEMRNVQPAGTQKVKNLPWPAPHTVNLIYWCKAQLSVYTVLKGHVPASGKEFLWGTAKPGCDLYSDEEMADNRPVTRVWFVREEGNYIRPVVDGFGIYYINFYAKWDNASKLDPQTQFGELLLTPSARSATLREFAQGFFNPASTACSILGRERCIERIRSLAALGEPELQRTACDFLKSEFRAACTQ